MDGAVLPQVLAFSEGQYFFTADTGECQRDDNQAIVW